MDKLALKKAIDACHEKGQKVALSFCNHVPAEILEAAGFCSLRVYHISDVEDISVLALPRNLCPAVKEVYSLLEDPVVREADLIITESSCDGKKKMYELISLQDKIWYYQVPQGSERDYVRPLIKSESGYMIKMLRDRFGIEVTNEDIRRAGEVMNDERRSVMALMELQKDDAPQSTGLAIYNSWAKAQEIPDRAERAAFLRAETGRLAKEGPKAAKGDRRILVTGCPASGIYEKIIPAIENNGGVVVCYENCEFAKTNLRHLDTTAHDMIEALVDCYQNTSCAIMGDNHRRFRLIEDLCREYNVEGIVDLSLTTCHAYTIEREKMHRFCLERDIPYLFIESDFSDTDAGRMNTRVAAFIELL